MQGSAPVRIATCQIGPAQRKLHGRVQMVADYCEHHWCPARLVSDVDVASERHQTLHFVGVAAAG